MSLFVLTSFLFHQILLPLNSPTSISNSFTFVVYPSEISRQRLSFTPIALSRALFRHSCCTPISLAAFSPSIYIPNIQGSGTFRLLWTARGLTELYLAANCSGMRHSLFTENNSLTDIPYLLQDCVSYRIRLSFRCLLPRIVHLHVLQNPT